MRGFSPHQLSLAGTADESGETALTKMSSTNTDPSAPKIESRVGSDLSPAALGAATRANFVAQLMSAQWLPSGTSPERQFEAVASAVNLMNDIDPAGAVERMLAVQMVAVHAGALECFRRAMIESQTVDGRDLNLKHAAKLTSMYLQMMDALNKHRGKGQQKVTVEHVHVEAGGQAAVGNFEPAGQKQRPGRQPNDGTKPIPFAPEKTLDMSVTSKVPAKKRAK